jgi:hypothetical protein
MVINGESIPTLFKNELEYDLLVRMNNELTENSRLITKQGIRVIRKLDKIILESNKYKNVKTNV